MRDHAPRFDIREPALDLRHHALTLRIIARGAGLFGRSSAVG
jgi:hypothetical protein